MDMLDNTREKMEGSKVQALDSGNYMFLLGCHDILLCQILCNVICNAGFYVILILCHICYARIYTIFYVMLYVIIYLSTLVYFFWTSDKKKIAHADGVPYSRVCAR